MHTKLSTLQAIYIKIVSYKSEILNFFKWLSVPVVFIALYYQLVLKTDYEQAWQIFKNSFNSESFLYLLIALGLMPVNLGTEAVKWQQLLKKLYPVSLLESTKSLLAGIAVSIFTPKRIGEYGGRILLLTKHRVEAVGSLFIGNLAQSIINLLIGLITILLYGTLFTLEVQNKAFILFFACLICAVLLLLYFNLQWVVAQLSNINYLKKKSISVDFLNRYKKRDLFEILFYSALKYLIFILQFVLIIKAFGIEIPLLSGIICASSVFFIKTMLPVPASVELAARGSIAIFFFSIFTENHIGILVASIVLWIVNLAIPSMIGSLIIAKSKI